MPMSFRILIVDDESRIRHNLRRLLERQGNEIAEAADGGEALRSMHASPFDLVIMDIRMPGMDGLEALARIRRIDPKIPVIIMTGHGSTETAIEATKRGAFEYHLKPFDLEQMRDSVQRALNCVRLMRQPVDMAATASQSDSETMIGQSPAMLEAFKTIGRVAATDATVLIRGETGTGKELVARAIYQHSQRQRFPLFVVDCGAIAETVLESELFGHEKGAFTHAIARRIGKFEQANRATILLDEVGDSPLAVQARLLRILQEGTIERVGGNETIHVDVRVLAATNQRLEDAIAAGRFRRDLYYRLNVVTVELPPLRERAEDISPLAGYFVARKAEQLCLEKPMLSAEALDALRAHSWPGNVRELEHCIHRALVLNPGYVLDAVDIQRALDLGARSSLTATASDEERHRELVRGYLESHSGEAAHPRFIEMTERLLVIEALRITNGNRSQAARLLGLNRTTLVEKIRRLDIPPQ